ncbi:MAG: hypothetical protein K2I47_07050 [Odoribacter sp.]|nr:hypothetical protein [Odoribacter sp.]
MLLEVFNKYLTELMYVEVYFTSDSRRTTCHFNTFRSRKQYLNHYTTLYQKVWQEFRQHTNLSLHHRYVSLKLNEADSMFILEGEEVISHRHILIFMNDAPVPFSDLNQPARLMLSAYLHVQYSALQELQHLCEEFFSIHRSCYVWDGHEIELLELLDSLWSTGYIRTLTQEKTKKMYFRRLCGFFNLPPPEDPCRRLGELIVREHPVSFLTALIRKYTAYWEEREG